ncbi:MULTISPECIES: DUF1858 domain-containing protein [Streptococcus]|uniref:DUF1858 domain-containing protein n=1 Tax=Streptococcus TaxID=1301 RepID=UPI00037AB6C3|nr:DUF1858 domain-containing protein [Streptococcus entericus]
MTNTIDLNQPVAELLASHPELRDILVDLGFKPLANPAMLNTLGKITSLKQGSRLTGISLETIARTLTSHGYEVIGGDK